MILTKESTTLVLRDPDFGNTDVIESRRIQRKSRGGDLIMFRDPIWPKTETFAFEFTLLKRNDLLGLIQFVELYLGQEITLTDHLGRTFQGIITTPSEELSQAGRDNYKAKFSFQVEL